MGKRIALLIGIDVYRDSGVHNLGGCVNDVYLIRDILQENFRPVEITILTSPVLATDPSTPEKTDQPLPTVANIKREFDRVAKSAGAGDLFFFHFSGHGAELPLIPESPNDGRTNDPSLLTFDYCEDGPAVRGWELNQWLEQLNTRKIQVIVTLDSCHSAGSWRDNRASLRTPMNPEPRPHIQGDRSTAEGSSADTISRHGELNVSWDINPENFTLMSACDTAEYAGESKVNGIRHGVFTNALKTYFDEHENARFSTYRTIRDFIATKISPQTPHVYGRDRLPFLGSQEVFSVAAVPVTIEDGVGSLELGRVHGIMEGAEFISRPPAPEFIFRVSQVNTYESQVKLLGATEQGLPQDVVAVPFRWSSGKSLKVAVTPTFSSEFQRVLYEKLAEKINGQVEVIEFWDEFRADDSTAIEFRLEPAATGGVVVFGPESLLGHEGPLRGLRITDQPEAQQATQSAAAIAHLLRFEQILHLRDQASSAELPFSVTLGSDGDSNEVTVSEGDSVNLTISYTGTDTLYITIMGLTPGFSVEMPRLNVPFPHTLDSKSTPWSDDFTMVLPNELKQEGLKSRKHRDIFRIIITKGKKLDFRSLELPDIWNADQMAIGKQGGGRHWTSKPDQGFNCWMVDKVVWTLQRV
ncbi:metacaspase-1A [Apiospora marii]|uniref:Metacaspase-1A n=1 Tax=Apiospora marii TaxID=335849 RepID=A0ABR1SQM8_9PEZI